MARTRNPVPAYQRHSSGCARVRTYDANGKRIEIILPGAYNSDESKEEYGRVLAQLRAGNGNLPAAKPSSDLTVLELFTRFMRDHVEPYYRREDGTPTGEQRNFIMSLRPLVRLFGRKLACEFSPLDLRTVREALITGSWMTDAEKQKRRRTRGGDGTTCRKETNKRIGRIKHMFKWAGEMMFVSPVVWHGLQCVSGLQAGRGPARESKAVEPIPLEQVEKTLPHLPEVFADIVRTQMYSGARAGEILRLRTCDIDKESTPDVWVFSPPKHKNAHRGHKRNIVFGPLAQLVLTKYLRPDTPEEYLFRPGMGRPRKQTNLCPYYETDDFDKAIGRAAKKAGVPHWSSHDLRRLAARLAEKETSLDGARAYLGQKSINMAAHYSGIDVKAAAKVAKKIG